ncbi:hypothetical protein PoB_000804400 [Plakobranchus ocellatus]|uniref:Uncharacterized protein n=1 Tax=Plakobranchus ocellatus TaxID=259542 RepID=A0AAV3YEY2_9GAST|nr:hypothetical protein PoB_000804400 [Plakobranchus ocellatus]
MISGRFLFDFCQGIARLKMEIAWKNFLGKRKSEMSRKNLSLPGPLMVEKKTEIAELGLRLSVRQFVLISSLGIVEVTDLNVGLGYWRFWKIRTSRESHNVT